VVGLDRATAARARIGEDRFLDIGQRQIERDAVGTARRIHTFLELKLTDDVQLAMADWAEANQRGSRGEHHYSAEGYGLTDDAIRDAFASYRDRFGELFE
jgi:hypothetical protein